MGNHRLPKLTKYLGHTYKYAKPTKQHRPAVWECVLGTVFALNDAYECKYFDYDWDAALAWAGVAEAGRDPRFYPVARKVQWVSKGEMAGNPKPGKRCLWVLKGKVA